MGLARVAVVDTPLGDKLVLRSMYGHEELGRPFRYELDLVSKDPDIDFSAVLGQTMSIELERPDGLTRAFAGYVTEFALVGGAGRNVHYRATLRPWLELLAQTTNCRIFQHMTVPDVIKQVFRDAGFSDFEDRLTESYASLEYLVQYRESDFAFISRIAERAGIYYYVTHAPGSHIVLLCDSLSAHDPVPGYETIPYFPPELQRRDRDHVDHWQLARKIKPGAVAATDFDFMRPRADLRARRVEPDEDIGAPYEEFDYPGPYIDTTGGDKEVRVRIEALHAEREVAEASGDAVGLAVGALFTLENFPREDQNKQYLVVRAHYQIHVNADESGIGGAGPAFRCEFSAIDAARRFRAARVTRKPIVEGPQTAIVVGPAGEELFSDEYGRVKVQFHWDRQGKADENSSCWVRVSQAWAGTSFGAIHIPRIGQEVIVDFIDGDPDRPIITGRVYNFDNQPPYELPANQTQSGFKSNSTKYATLDNYNELRFEDKLGSEQVYMQAEKDLEVLVKNEEQRTVRASRMSTIGTDDTLDVGQNRTATVGSNDQETVTGTQTVAVGLAQAIFVGAARTVTSGSEMITTGIRVKNIATSDTANIGSDSSVTVRGNQSVAVGGNQTLTTNGHRKQAVDKDETLSVVGGRQQTVNKSDQLQVGERLVLTAGQEIVLQVGDATFTMKKNGDVYVKGNNILVDGSGKVSIKGASDVIVKGSKIANN